MIFVCIQSLFIPTMALGMLHLLNAKGLQLLHQLLRFSSRLFQESKLEQEHLWEPYLLHFADFLGKLAQFQ